MDFSKMKKSEQLVALGAVVAGVSAFLPWYTWKIDWGVWGGTTSGSVNGLTSYGWLSFIAAVLAGLMVILPLLGTKLPKLGVENWLLYVVFGAVAGGAPVLVLLNSSSYSGASIGASAGPGFGLFGAIAGGALVLVGGFMEKGGTKTSVPTPPPAA